MNSTIQRFVQLGHHPNDSKDEKLKKSSLLVVSGPFALAGLIWGLLYYSNGLIIPGSIPFSYAILSLVSIVQFSITKRYQFFRNSQLFLILILPFALQLSLGGFVQSSAVLYWAIIAPASAMFFDSVKRSGYWFIAYLFLIVIAYLIDGLLPEYVNHDLSEGFVHVLFLMNMIGVSSIVFGILYYFVSTITKLNDDIESKNSSLREQSEQLRDMDELKSRFFANISHEFRTPLTLILGLIKKQRANASQPPNLKDGQVMQQNAQRLLQLINQLLDLSKLESGGVTLKVTQSDVVMFVKNSTSQFESMATEKQLRLSFNGRPVDTEVEHSPIELIFDHEKLQKVLINLISNAIKFTSGGGEISVEVEKMSNPNADEDAVAIRVINTGEIPQEALDKIFHRFFQVDSDSNRSYEGTGIGLALAKDLVELHGGKISVSSKMGKVTFNVHLPMEGRHLEGAEFIDIQAPDTIEVPVDILSPISAGKDSLDLENFEHTDSKLEVLIVEDNTDLRAFIRNIISDEYHVIEAVDGIDGFEKAESSIPDLIVSDVMMPRMDGYEMCKSLKTNDKTNHVPIILLTAKATRENKLEGLGLGADDYLLKPFDEEELKVRMRNLIGIRKKLQQKFQRDLNLRPDAAKPPTVQHKFISDLKEIVDQNLDNEQFSVEDLGKEIGMSRSQLHRKLKALADQSATTFIRNYRLHRAADLLTNDAGNITEIAYQVGFNSQTYFSSSFQELFGCAPTAYRQKMDGRGDT